ncbi:hypothetical protein HY493_02500 [Candidatus Woesearchaeota archaeon]|nr:hypothetical protein [Candidatus Woesearchaeota archaeon]
MGVEETSGRLCLAQTLVERVSDCIEGAIVGGSVGYGNANAGSDIDLPVLAIPERAWEAIRRLGFVAPSEAQVLFRTREIDCLYLSDVLGGIEVNCFIYDPDAYSNFVSAATQDGLRIFRSKKPRDMIRNPGFDGVPLEIHREVQEVSGGYVYRMPTLAGGNWYMAAVRQDYFCSGKILFQRDGRLAALEQAVWTSAIAHLVKEHGRDVDLGRFNILNAHWTHHNKPGRLPESVARGIVERTKKELEKYLRSQQ